MTEPNASVPGESIDLFQELITRLMAGLRERIEGDLDATPAEVIAVERGAFGNEVPGGALLGRTAWKAASSERSGCFLWMGNLGSLLGGEEKHPSALSEAEVDTLTQSLRLNVEEGGDDDILLDWTDLEPVGPETLGTALRESGIPERTQGVRFTLRISEAELTFVFFEAPSADRESPAAGAPEEEPEAAVVEDPAPAAETAPEAAPVAAAPGAALPPDPEHLKRLLDLRLPLTIRLGSTHLSLDDVLGLIPGSIVELDQREEEPLEVLANGSVIARGEVVVVDDRFGLRITEIVSSEARLTASA